ncbi:MAG: cyclic lactone autoinducer peptide [Lachnospiraceae bacterium]|nr:cyclic lactone autoinducer peptide [Lachnospiraceae bacterium]
MKKIKKFNVLALLSVVATFFATTVATSACFWYLYQPEEPECLKEM